jgi:hypothetical protein
MSSPPTELLYSLLPVAYKLRDAEQGEPLRALLGILENTRSSLQQDIEQLYENWFIETCEDWVTGYIGDLLGVHPLYPVSAQTVSPRSYIANTFVYRRGKGTAATLEQMAADVTGWPAHVVEFFEILATAQYMNHLRPEAITTISVRDPGPLELIGGPFESAARVADMRPIGSNRGQYNIPNLGIFLWRLMSFPVVQSVARALVSNDGRFHFHPMGFDAPLFNQPQVKSTGLAQEINVPGMLRRLALYDELEARRQAIVDGSSAPALYFGGQPVLAVWLDGTLVPPERVAICNLSDNAAGTDWNRPPTQKSYTPSADGAAISLPITLSVDPVLGRIALPAGNNATKVKVSYSYGFSGELGGGPYDRNDSLQAITGNFGPSWQVGVSRDLPSIPHLLFSNLADAIAEWNLQKPGIAGVIAIMDSETYPENLSGPNQVQIPAGSKLLIVAADWPRLRLHGDAADSSLTAIGIRPHVLANISIDGTAGPNDPAGQLFLNGLVIEGSLLVPAGNLGVLNIQHSTIHTGSGGVTIQAGSGQSNATLQTTLERCITGPVVLPLGVVALSLTDSIVASGLAGDPSLPAITAPSGQAQIESCTVLGSTSVQVLQASNSIFMGVVTAARRQIGCTRFCSLASGSRTSRRYRCQPDLALENVTDLQQRQAIVMRLVPQFSSLDASQPAFAQLALTCAPELRTGAVDGAEMGAFRFLSQPQREANLRATLDEYLRFGLEAGLYFVT